MIEIKIARRTLLLGALGSAAALSGCAWRANAAAQADRDAVLAAAIPMPDESRYDTHYLDWNDAQRQRPVPAKLYLPAPRISGRAASPLLVLSHGLGGSRDGYSYLGKFLAAEGHACLHVQHVGSDRRLWGGNPLELVGRLKAAAQESEALARVQDLRFALDQVLAGPHAQAIDATQIAVAGHSYGANTSLLVSGADIAVEAPGAALPAAGLRDARIRAAVLISAPPFYGRDMRRILAPVGVPNLHITSTGDEIQVPGYHSAPEDRIAVFDATGGRPKTLAVFKDGSHSMFTDRLNTGGASQNPQVKLATRQLVLAFLNRSFQRDRAAFTRWPTEHQALLARFESLT